jgi:hypothetical protein
MTMSNTKQHYIDTAKQMLGNDQHTTATHDRRQQRNEWATTKVIE